MILRRTEVVYWTQSESRRSFSTLPGDRPLSSLAASSLLKDWGSCPVLTPQSWIWTNPSFRLLGLVGNGRDPGQEQSHGLAGGQVEVGGEDGDHQAAEGGGGGEVSTEGHQSSPLLNSSTLLGQKRRNCNALSTVRINFFPCYLSPTHLHASAVVVELSKLREERSKSKVILGKSPKNIFVGLVSVVSPLDPTKNRDIRRNGFKKSQIPRNGIVGPAKTWHTWHLRNITL